MTRFTSFVMACVRCWTRLYTWRLPPAVRDARREEIESDLWESSHDPGMTQAELAIQTVMRMTLGIADNLAWRFVQLTVTTHVTLRSLTAAAVLCMLLLFAMLSQLTRDVPPLPRPPVASLQVHRRVPDPPPPPPPPDATPGWKPIFQYGRTSVLGSDGRASPGPHQGSATDLPTSGCGGGTRRTSAGAGDDY